MTSCLHFDIFWYFRTFFISPGPGLWRFRWAMTLCLQFVASFVCSWSRNSTISQRYDIVLIFSDILWHLLQTPDIGFRSTMTSCWHFLTFFKTFFAVTWSRNSVLVSYDIVFPFLTFCVSSRSRISTISLSYDIMLTFSWHYLFFCWPLIPDFHDFAELWHRGDTFWQVFILSWILSWCTTCSDCIFCSMRDFLYSCFLSWSRTTFSKYMSCSESMFYWFWCTTSGWISLARNTCLATRD